MITTSVLHLGIAIAALGGLCISVYIHHMKHTGETLTCPIGHSCDPVVHSKYSRFMNMPVEMMGVVYYTATVISYSLFLLMPSLYSGPSVTILLIFSALAFIFSAYLIGVQLFILREWCTWCIISAILCTIIFFTALNLSGIETLGMILGELEIRN